MKSRTEMLQKLGVSELNTMQIKALDSISSNTNTVLLSPTGTGKTLAFLLPIIEFINPNTEVVQALIIVPTRELALQIEQVVRDMGAGIKANAVYGGQSFNQDRLNLKHTPSLIIGTPGRVSDHLRRNTFSLSELKFLVLDEFDKSLEIGFEPEMKQISKATPKGSKRVLTSATNEVTIPEFIELESPSVIDNADKGKSKMSIYKVSTPTKDKLETLVALLSKLQNETGIVFCNFKDSIDRVSDYLHERGVPHGCFYGGLEQHDRELSLLKFRNGSHRVILATDLAARGLDIPEIQFIVHYHLPLKEHEFVHRNGRTARMHKDGEVYVLHFAQESLPDYLSDLEEAPLINKESPIKELTQWKTIMLSAGRREKISKGDIAGLCYKEGGLDKGDLGVIELKADEAFFAVKADKALDLIQQLNGKRLKKAKLRVSGV
ncbi:MAG: DEAD/DEAH box helicase [Salibacteraceae bacterium]